VSLQAKLAKRLLRFWFSGWSQGTIAEQRARQEKSIRWTRLPADVHCRPVSAAGIAAEWIEAPDADQSVILYLHGGAYALGSVNTHREFVARLARATGMRGLAINYRLAPEHPFPAALEDATGAYDWLLAEGVEPSRIIIAGDSAGGGLALAALVALRDAGKPLPAGAVCISPWMDLALTGASIQSKAHADPVLDPDSLERYAMAYAGERDRTSPLISPLYADLTGLPPLLIQVASDEILLDDATRFAERAREAGVDATLEVWNGMFHVFQLVSLLPETREAVAQVAEFVRQNFTGDNLE
jgi:acetyl esterase/lipase